MKAQQWKFKAQAIPCAQGNIDGVPSPPPPSFRRKRRHSEPHLQQDLHAGTTAYKNYVTHWKLPTTSTSIPSTNNIINNGLSITNSLYSVDTINNTSHPTSKPNINSINANFASIDSNIVESTDDLKSTQKQLSQPHVWRPSPVSPTSQSPPHVTPPSPHPSDNIQQWKPEPFKSMFHPYKRGPLSPSSPSSSSSSAPSPSSSSMNTLQSQRDRRRNSAPHISYPHAPPRDNRLETIPELSFPSHSHISPPPVLAPLGSSAFSTPPSLKTLPPLSPLLSPPSSEPALPSQGHHQSHQKRNYDFFQQVDSGSTSSDPINSLPFHDAEATSGSADDIPKFARNTRRRMSVDNLLA
jgi:hypothetical protein